MTTISADSKTLYMTTFISIQSAPATTSTSIPCISMRTVDFLFSRELNARNNNKADRALTGEGSEDGGGGGRATAMTTTSTGITKTTKYKSPIGHREVARRGVGARRTGRKVCEMRVQTFQSHI